MKAGIIDVGEWQSIIDFKTGNKIYPDNSNTLMNKMQELVRKSPYHGDKDIKSNEWVSKVALELDQIYEPDFMFLNYASPFIRSVFCPEEERQWQVTLNSVFEEVQNFIDNTGFTPIIVGTGSTIPLEGNIDLSSLDGLALCGGMGSLDAGLYEASSKDLEFIRRNPCISKIVSREELVSEWCGNEEFISRLPDYLLIANEGYVFRGTGSMSRPMFRISARDRFIPVSSPLPVKNISDIAGVASQLLKKERVALIVIEGVGIDEFQPNFLPCEAGFGWYTYYSPDNMYLVMCSGKHLSEHKFPPGYRYFDADTEDKPYPFSGMFDYLPEDVIGNKPGIRSGAVGSRSMLTHIASGADISVECFVRALYNYGCMVVMDY